MSDTIGVATLVVLFGQLVVFTLQLLVFWKQVQLGQRESEGRRVEAIGTFYRAAHDLVRELAKANVLPTVPIQADPATHPRQLLREASHWFAPLGDEFNRAINQTATQLDEYFLAVLAYNDDRMDRKQAGLWQAVQTMREQVGRYLDQANGLIPPDNRWGYFGGKDYDFRALCSLPPAFPQGDSR